MAAKPRARRASLTIELLLITPVLVAVVIAAVEFALLIAAEHRLESAAALAARVAAQGGDAKAVSKAVHDSLGGGRWEKVEVKAILEDDGGRPLAAGSNVEVVVTIDAAQVVPDLLGFVGFSLKDQTLRGRALLRKE